MTANVQSAIAAFDQQHLSEHATSAPLAAIRTDASFVAARESQMHSTASNVHVSRKKVTGA